MLKRLTFILLLITTLFCSFSEGEYKTENEVIINDDIKDTIPAFVMYGSRFLLDSLENFDESSILEFRDSLNCFINKPTVLIDYINLYLSITKMSKLEVINLKIGRAHV